MNYQKIDSELAGALDRTLNPEERALPVFIHTACVPNPAQADFLMGLGVLSAMEERKVFAGTLSPRAVAELSDQPWVSYLRLSNILRLLNDI